MVVRLYKDIVSQVLLVLMRYRDDDEQRFELAAQAQPTYAATGQELIDLLTRLVTEEPAEQDLIDKIVIAVRLPFVSNRMSLTSIQLLRDAVLLPSEIDAFERSLDSHWQCGNCQHILECGEVATLRSDGDGTAQLRCAGCADLMYIACNSGRHQVTIPSSLRSKLLKLGSECRECQVEASRPGGREPATAPGWAPLRAGIRTPAASVTSASLETIRRWQDALTTQPGAMVQVEGLGEAPTSAPPLPQAAAGSGQISYQRLYEPIMTRMEQATYERQIERARHSQPTPLDIAPDIDGDVDGFYSDIEEGEEL